MTSSNRSGRSGAELAGGGLRELWKWAKTSFEPVDAATLHRRLEACRRCPEYVAAPAALLHRLVERGISLAGEGIDDPRVCAHCGCFMAVKARLGSASCPAADPSDPSLTRWGEPCAAPPVADTSRALRSSRTATGPKKGLGHPEGNLENDHG